MNEQKLNGIVIQIEYALRKTNGKWCYWRFNSIKAETVRQIILENRIGLVCEKCLKPRRVGRYCCKEHRQYYNQIVQAFYFKPKPIEERFGCEHNSMETIDHILPIANGGLEFDRTNLQYMCLLCNLRKSGGKRYADKKAQTKLFGKKIMGVACRNSSHA